MKPMTWLFLGAAGVGAWWLLRAKNGVDACAQALAAMPADQRPPPALAPNFEAIYLKHCRAASAAQRGCFTTFAEEPPPECMPALMPMVMEIMPGMMGDPATIAAQRAADDAACRADPACQVVGDPGVDPWPAPGTETGGGTIGPQLLTSEAPQGPTPEGMGYAGGIYARHLFAGMT